MLRSDRRSRTVPLEVLPEGTICQRFTVAEFLMLLFSTLNW